MNAFLDARLAAEGKESFTNKEANDLTEEMMATAEFDSTCASAIVPGQADLATLDDEFGDDEEEEQMSYR